MLQDQLITIKKQLSHIVDVLILNGTLTDCSGLINGKIGIAVFFFHYARYTKNILFADYAYDLIEEIQKQIHLNSPVDYENGIAGIGVGIDYLIQKDFLVTEDDIFEDLDERMVHAVLDEPYHNFSLYSGLLGYGRYWISRLSYKPSSELARKCLTYIVGEILENLPNISIEEQIEIYYFFHDLERISGFVRHMKGYERIKEWTFKLPASNNCFSRLRNSVVGEIVMAIQHNRYVNDFLQRKIEDTLEQWINLDIGKTHNGMGLLTGYAGAGLLRLGVINQMDLSWMMLL